MVWKIIALDSVERLGFRKGNVDQVKTARVI